MLHKKKKTPKHDIVTIKAEKEATAQKLDEYATHRATFLRCSGMHTKEVRSVIHQICSGNVKGPGVGFVAPALYEGIPEFLDKTLEALGEIAVYSSLYMALVATAGMSGYTPQLSILEQNIYYNGVFSSMMCHSGAVLMTVIYRLAAAGHLRDSDKLLYLWRARYAPLAAALLFGWGLVCATVMLMYSIGNTVAYGGACFANAGDSSIVWTDWWYEWVEKSMQPVGTGVIHEVGKRVENPWIKIANEKGIKPPAKGSWYYLADQTLKDQYSEFMKSHW